MTLRSRLFAATYDRQMGKVDKASMGALREGVRADEARLAHRQDRLNGLNRFLVGCECNRPTLASIQAAGFDVVHAERHTMPKVPTFVSPFVAGRAETPAEVVTPDKL